MAPVAAARLHEMAGLITRLAAVELFCAAQAIDLRGNVDDLGTGTAAAYRLTRGHHPAGDLLVDSGERLNALAAELAAD